MPIFAFTPNAQTFQSLALYWGVTPVLFTPASVDGQSIFVDIDRVMLRRDLLRSGDRVVITFGYPIKAHKSVNLLKLHVVGESLPSRSST